MKQAELQHFRDLLREQALEPEPKRGLFRRRAAGVVVSLSEGAPAGPSAQAPPPAKGLFGRRRPEPDEARSAEPLLLEDPIPAPEPEAGRLRLRVPTAAGHFSETPFHPEDLADPTPTGPAPGIIAGWSAVKPPSAQLRLLRRLHAVICAEHEGLTARLAAAEAGAG